MTTPASSVTSPSKDLYLLRVGDLEMLVDAAKAGRIVRFARRDHNVLLESSAQPEMYGSTFWTSPQNGEGGWGWPPVVEIDSAPYRAEVTSTSLLLSGPRVKVAGAEISVSKRFEADAATETILVSYVIANHGAETATFAPWEITRVAAKGLTFFPTGRLSEPLLGKLRPLVEESGISWFDWQRSAPLSGDGKFCGDGSEGWVAHAAGALLMVKRFEDVLPGQQAPGEGEIELYAEADKLYEEVEQQGRYAPILPGHSLTWSVRWALVPLSAPAVLGDPALVALARGVGA